MEGRPHNMLVSPLDVENVLSRVREFVGHSVLPLPLVFDVHLVAGFLWSVDADKEDVVAGVGAVHGEGVLFAQNWAVNAGSLAGDGSSI